MSAALNALGMCAWLYVGVSLFQEAREELYRAHCAARTIKARAHFMRRAHVRAWLAIPCFMLALFSAAALLFGGSS